MSFRRLVVPLLAAVALTAAMLSSPAPSSAAQTRNVTFSTGKINNSTFYVVGRAENWNREYVQLQKRDCRAARCKFHSFRATISGSKGGFRFQFKANVGNCFRIFIRASQGYKWVLKPVGCIVRR